MGYTIAAASIRQNFRHALFSTNVHAASCGRPLRCHANIIVKWSSNMSNFDLVNISKFDTNITVFKPETQTINLGASSGTTNNDLYRNDRGKAKNGLTNAGLEPATFRLEV